MTTAAPRRRIGIVGVGSYLPARRRTNEDIAATAGVTPDWITRRTGVRGRHVAAPEEAASDLAAAAVKSAAGAADLDLDRIGLLVVATSTPDELGPSTACRVQAHVRARDAVALDVTAACSGWLFAAKVAHDWLALDDRPRYAAVVGVEAYSKFLDLSDRATAVLFADGAAATVFGPVPEDGGFLGFALGSNGELADHALIPAGGSRHPASLTTLESRGHKVTMNGPGVRDFIVDIFPRIVADALRRHHLTLADIAVVITHQPNPVLLQRVAHAAGITPRQLVIVGDEVGNIGAASIPYGLATAVADGRLNPGDLVLFVAFGGGVTWGTALLRWTGASAIRTAPGAAHRARPRPCANLA
ncbi:3-oxoacyl-ACP synthase III family protein [Streptantibioticus cattleyicolor]|uniref:3-oxoacyl-(Acyl-carrier-protein) synthase III n=1 Tax=Streptantibioticus cattleyicolor (strain ATCC 35852 / DSM 46488 / JCM 4925 / NBRC 14057 / NRRL 8057) TaxID=1003195 RepID=F8JJG6_STREN|nr:ketoacyl-ACP synthase III [Streptantibioticus cattleyicolor]AEW98708.1 3-oxoacyl-(acyl-carrier-protein) synthase III [Streptantibioticus cattleyicolor NRRL 8057 = DSM 46488]CCB72236.1 3-oxoacyl-[acyl-carrier-protein] synthase 3 [Streptantibioticus cattleyicolor NRRL 8057 = DSM 46488]